MLKKDMNRYYNPPSCPPDGYFTEKKLVDGTTILVAHTRIGDDERRWMGDFLGDMCARGFLDPQEHEARQERVQQAVTRNELNVLISDLPEDAEEWRKRRKAKPDPEMLRREVEKAIPHSRVSLVQYIVALMIMLYGAMEIFTWSLQTSVVIGACSILTGVAALAWAMFEGNRQ